MAVETAASGERGPSGVLVVDKPSGPTSFDIVAGVRRVYRQRAVGHAGTLDPLATGVLVVMLGEATKLCDYLTAANKTYEAEITFGRSTDTLDSQGATVSERSVSASEVLPERVLPILAEERNRTQQVPPIFSAIKQAGETAYKKARRGETVELAPRLVRVHDLQVLELTAAGLRLSLNVSKGYYVRALARDICGALGVPGCLTSLRRTASGAFSLADAVQWPFTAADHTPLSAEEAARRSLPCGTLTVEGRTRARHGKTLVDGDFEQRPHGSPAAWFGMDGRLVALGETLESADRAYKVLRGFSAHGA